MRRLIGILLLLALAARADTHPTLPVIMALNATAEEAWTPAVDMPSTSVWICIDFTDSSTWWEDDGTDPAEDGDLVYRVDDQSTNEYHATQVTESYRPTVDNGRVSFDGADNCMTSWVHNAPGQDWNALQQPYEIWACFHAPTDPSAHADVVGVHSPLVTARPNWVGGKALYYAGATGVQHTKLLAGDHILGAYFDGASSGVYTNGILADTGNIGSNWLGSDSPTGTGRIRYCWSANYTGAHLDAELVAVLITRGLQDADTRQKIEGWMAHKGEMADTALPSDHPYKATPP